MSGFEWYTDFVDLGYKPSEDDLIALFRVYPARGYSMEEAAGRVASESSIGTWTTLTTMNDRIRGLMAKVYEISGYTVKIAYPSDLFEPGNIPQILSSIAGNIFGMRALRGLRLEDVKLPKSLVRSFKGPQFGIDGVRAKLKVYNRPITATVPKPKVGMTSEEHARAAYEALVGGIDLIKDDENLSSQNFNRFERRLAETFKAIERAERETGEKKGYLINVTAETKEMIRRAKLVADYGGDFIMIDILTTGWSALQTMREVAEEYKLAIHAHRAFHAAFTRNRRHGMSMLAVAKMARLAGVDHLHVGTAIGKLESTRREVVTIKKAITEDKNRETRYTIGQDWCGLKPVFPVSSGGLHPGLIPEILRILGWNIIVQVGGGVWGHPRGGTAGAKAVRQAIDAAMKGIPLTEYAEEHAELREALNKWGYVKPR